MTIPVKTALAPTFAWVAAAYDFRFTFSGSPAVDVIVPSGNYRMVLGPSSGDGADFVRAAESAINSAFATAGLSDTVALTVSAAGNVTMFLSRSAVVAASQGMRVLGLTPGTGAIFAATFAPQHLALFASVTEGVWQPTQTGGAERLSDGRVYAVGSTATSWQRTVRARFIPWSPAVRAEYQTGATALWPDAAYLESLGSTAADREWSVLDVLQDARNVVCGLALGTWLAVKGSTTERYDRVYVAPASLLSPEVARADDVWEAFVELPLTFSRPATSPTGTRA